jgi:glycosyltransferase involved in cell wall biosynthesis
MFAAQLASHLNATGNEACLVFVFPGEAALPFKGKTFHLNGKPSKRMFDAAAWKTLADIIKAEQPDVVQANAGDTLKYAVASKLRFGWKQPIVFRNASTISLYIKSLAAKLFNGFFFRFTDLVISVSQTSASDFARLFPRYKEKIITIPIGIEEPALDHIPAPVKTSGEPLRIIHVGGFSFEKNHRGLISIFEKLLKSGRPAVLELVGNGILKTEIEELAKAKGLSDKIIFHGFRNDAMELIKKADVLVLPSIIEGLPGVILEAFYCRTPVVAYNVGGIHEIVHNGDTGYLVEKHDEEAFVTAIDRIAEGNNTALTDKAYELVKKEYLNKEVAGKFVRAYERLLRN